MLLSLGGRALPGQPFGKPAGGIAQSGDECGIPGELQHACGQGADVAVGKQIARLHVAQRIAEQWRTLRHQDQERRELIANVSHDLRTPLTSLHGFLETLAHKRDLSDAERERYLKTALAQSSKVARLAHELFELARLEHDPPGLEQESFSLADLLHDVVQELGLLAAAKRQRLHMDVPPHLPNVVGSLRLIDRALTNLISNAIQHTPAGGEIAVALRAVGGGVEVVVRDDGPGIPPEVREALSTPATLGGRRAHVADSPHVALTDPQFRAYADHMMTAAFRHGLARLETSGREARTAIMCAERLPSECHRSLISDALVARGVAVGHIVRAGGAEPHALSAGARRTEDGIVYDVGAQLTLDAELRDT